MSCFKNVIFLNSSSALLINYFFSKLLRDLKHLIIHYLPIPFKLDQVTFFFLLPPWQIRACWGSTLMEASFLMHPKPIIYWFTTKFWMASCRDDHHGRKWIEQEPSLRVLKWCQVAMQLYLDIVVYVYMLFTVLSPTLYLCSPVLLILLATLSF